MSEPRIWRLRKHADGAWGPSVEVETIVVEAAPVAELLERLMAPKGLGILGPAQKEARALLAALRKHESRDG